MKVLIAGATGAIGRPLVRLLLAGGYEVIGITRNPGKSDSLTRQGARALVADVMDRDSLLKSIEGLQVDAVVHALTALPKSGPLRDKDMYQTDALRDVGTSNLLAAARAVGARKIVVESMHVGYGFGDWGETVLTEEQPFAPPGRTPELEKHLAGFRSLEQQTFQATREGWIEGISLRFGAFYGPGAGDAQVEALRKRSLPLVAGGRTFMTWIYNEDAASAIVAALERGKGGEAYNIVDDEPVSWHDFLIALAQAVGAPRPFSVPRWLLKPLAPYGEVFIAETSIRASNAKAKRELGWTPTNAPTYREGVQKVAQALKPASPLAS